MNTDTLEKYKEIEPYKIIKIGWFEAYIHLNNLRDTHNQNMTSVLLTDIVEVDTNILIRDHSWLKINPIIKSFLEKFKTKNNKKIKVIIKAELFNYIDSNGEKKLGIRFPKTIYKNEN